MTYDPAWRERAVSAAELIARVRSGQRLFVHGAAATPTPLLDALAERRELSERQQTSLSTTPLLEALAIYLARQGDVPGLSINQITAVK